MQIIHHCWLEDAQPEAMTELRERRMEQGGGGGERQVDKGRNKTHRKRRLKQSRETHAC